MQSSPFTASRIFLWCAVCLTGCSDLESALDPEAEGRSPVTPPGIATPEDVASAGETAPPVAQQEPAAPDPAAGDDPAAQPPAADPAGDGKGIIGKTTNEVVDLHEAMQDNPGLQVEQNGISGSDPLSAALTAYVSVRSRASQLGMQSELKNFSALNGRPPAYDEFTAMMKRHDVQFAMLYPWQKYGYDAKQGMIVVLSDPAEKARRREAAGLDPGN